MTTSGTLTTFPFGQQAWPTAITLGPDGKVSLRFEPHLPGSFFTDKETVRVFVDPDGVEQAVRVPKDAFAFRFLGATLVTYRNPKRLDTFGKQRVSVRRITLHDRGKKLE